MNKIDVYFDFREESKGKDPDRWSPTLQEYHRILWSKPLPNGEVFTLDKKSQNRLFHKSDLGEFYLSSDVALFGFIRKCQNLDFIKSKVSNIELNKFKQLTTNTLGGIMLWPSVRIDNKLTINGARGFNRQIADRLDLTIECVRRYYLGEDSPLDKVFNRYSDFFNLFGDFKGYIDFFLLNDIIDEKEEIKFSLPFDNFKRSPLPTTVEEYKDFVLKTTAFVNARNKRILDSL